MTMILDKKKSILNDYDTLIHLASEIGVGANVNYYWDRKVLM